MNMREKIARAILSKVPQGYGMTEAEASEYADAVLDALMKPTEGMLAAVPASHSVSFQAIWPKICGDVFTAMIQAAKEGR